MKSALQSLCKSTLSSMFVVALALLWCHSAMATTYYSGSATGDPTLLTSWWDTTGGTGNHPANFTSGDTFVIQSGHTYTIPFNTIWTVNATTGGTAATVQVNSGGTLTFTLSSGSTCKLLIGGNFKQSGTVSGTTTSTTGVFEFTSSGTWTGSGDISNVKASIQVDSGVTLDASGMSAGFKLKSSNTIGITVNGILNIGTLTINGNGNGSASFTLGASGTLITATTSASGVPGIFTGFSATKITLPTTANYTFNGAAAQVTGTTANNATMPSTVNNLTFNNTAGVTLSQTTTVNGTLTLTAGKVTGNAILASNTGLSGGSSTAYINGQLTVPFSNPSSVSYTFPVGTASAYSPITLASFSASGSDTLTASATASQNPNAGSGIDGSLYIARYWTLTDNGGFSSPTYNFTGTYVASDIQNGADPNNLIVRKWNSGWTAPTSSASSPYSVTGTGFSGSFGQFATGQAQTTLPNLDSLTKSAITNTAATLGATLENDFGFPVTEYGIVWGTSPSPTTANNKVQMGTSLAAPNSFSGNISGLPVATTVYYRGYAINSSGTGYSTNGSFLTLTNEPTVQASSVSIAARQNGNLVVSWTRGNGARCIVLVKSGSAVDSDPADGASYTANAAFASGSQIGSGNYVAYLGTGTSITLTTLSASTTYYVAVYELNGTGGSENYLTASPATGNQTTVANPATSLTWTGNQDNEWTNANNWNPLQAPDVGTPLTVSATGNLPIYSNQMATASVGPITNSGPLTIATNVFVIDAAGAVPLTLQPSGVLTINTNAIVTITNSGSVTMSTPTAGTPPLIDVEGGSLILTNNSGAFFMGDNTSTDTGIGAVITNNGGHIVIDQQLRVRCRDSRFYMSGGTLDLLGGLNHNVDGNDARQFFTIAGGTANLGAVTIDRATTAGGLSVEGGVVNSSSIRIGTGIASANSRMTGGIWTNAGAFYIGDRNNAATSGTRNPIFNMSSGFLVTAGSDGIVINNQGESSATGLSGNGGILQVSGGTIITEGIYLNGPSVTANSAASFQFTGGTVYLGTIGLVTNTAGASMTASLTLNGGTFGAKTAWASAANLPLSGPLTFNAADVANTAHNITLNGAVSGGSGAVIKTGAGILTLNGANTYGGATTISNGILALGATGTLANSAQITLSSGATFDVSATGFTLGSGKLLGGSGTVIGALTAGPSSTISVGNSIGTLTFSSGLILGGNTIINYEISPTTNDLIEVAGNVDASTGPNTLSITAIGGVLAPGTYTLIHYTGSLIGTINNFSLIGAPGYLTNNTTANAIQLVTTGVRAPANIVWVGNSLTNDWDVLNHTNWLNGAVLDSFVQGDAVLFNATGAAHPSVNITAPVSPALITVDATTGYTFSGSGAIGGIGGLTKTNTGTLVILTTNSYTGPTIIGQGTLEAAQLANGGANSAIGAANNSTNNLVFGGGTLKYSGATASTDRGAILNDGGGVLSVTNSAAVLTHNGIFVGVGTLTKAGSGTLVLANANSHAGGTVVSNGVLQINNASSLGAGGFTNIGATLKIGAAMTVSNVVDFEGNCAVDLNNSSGDIALNGAWTGSGAVTVLNQPNAARTFTVGGNGYGGGTFTGFSGTLNMGTNSAFLRFNDGGGSPNLGSPNMTLDLGTASATLLARNGGITIDIGTLRGGPATRVMGRGTGTAGTITYSIGALGIDSTFAGTITNNASDVAVTKVGTGKLTLSGTNTYTGATSMNGGELQVNGAIVSSTISVGSGVLSGSGWIGGPTAVYTLLAPGSGGIGTLTFSNTLTIDVGSTNNFVVTSSGGASNHVSVVGTLGVNSSVIHITSGSALAAGTYNLFTYGSISGSFDPTPVFDVAPTGTPSIVDNGLGQINLVIASSSGPSLTGLDISNLQSGTVGISATNGTPNGFFAVLVSTNLTLPIASWTSIVTNQFDSNGAFSGTVSVNPTAPQQFLMLQQLP